MPAITADGKHNGFPTICRVNGVYHIAYRKSSNHAPSKGKLVRRHSSDGVAWSPEVTLYEDTTYDVGDPSYLVHPVTGQILLTFGLRAFAMYDEWIPNGGRFCSSLDGVTFSTPIVIPSVQFPAAAWQTGPVVVCGNGDLLAPLIGGPTTACSVSLARSTDGGVTWQPDVILHNAGVYGWSASEVVIRRLANGSMLALFRDNGNRRVYRRYSNDDGGTWSEPVLVRSGWGKPAFVQLGYGRLIHIYRDAVTLDANWSTSDDNGVTWSTPTVLLDSLHTMTYADAHGDGLEVTVVHGDEVTNNVSNIWITKLTIPYQVVASQTPIAGTLVAPNTVVNVTLETPQTVAVPNLIGLSEAQARDACQAAGLLFG